MTTGTYTVQCFYGTATTVDVSNTATPHSCEKTMNVREANTNNINGCSRIYAYKGSTLSDEMTSPAAFSASFRCGSRLPSDTVTNPFILRLGTTAPAFLLYDTVMSEFFNGFAIGPISTQTNNYDFVTGSTPVSCAVRV